MKRNFVLSTVTAAFGAAAAFALSAPASAQGFAAPVGSYDGYYDYERPVPPRPVPDFGRETVVTTTRRVVTTPPVYGYPPAQTVVTTRRVVRPAPVLDEEIDGDFAASAVRPLPPPIPVRRIVKSEPVVAPDPVLVGERVVARPIAPREAVVIEERRVETTRRVVRPADSEWLD